MSKMHWSDGITVDTSGPYRVIKLYDGYYVVGHGLHCPVDTMQKGLDFIKQLISVREKK